MDSSFYKGWWPRLIRDPPEGGVTASLLLSGFTGAKLPKGLCPGVLGGALLPHWAAKLPTGKEEGSKAAQRGPNPLG
jgi:hypothetical protein